MPVVTWVLRPVCFGKVIIRVLAPTLLLLNYLFTKSKINVYPCPWLGILFCVMELEGFKWRLVNMIMIFKLLLFESTVNNGFGSVVRDKQEQ